MARVRSRDQPIRCRFAAALLLAASAACRAGDEDARPLDVSDQGTPVFTVYGTQDGLSDEIWSTIGFDARGFVWAGSASELARFDGYRWTLWPFPEAASLVRDMEPGAHGDLWAIFEREGLARYDGRAWSLYGGEPMFHQRFSTLARADGARELWVGHRLGFWKLDGTTWKPDPGNDSVPPGNSVRIEQTETLYGQPRQWMVRSEGGLWYRPLAGANATSAWQRFDAPGLEEQLHTDLRRTVDRGREELWLLTYGGGVYRLTDDGLRAWRAASGELPTEAMYSAVSSTGSAGERLLWIASRAGLLRIRGDTVTVLDRRHGLPSDAVRGIKLQQGLDGTDLLWLATEGGIARAALADSRWRTVSLLGARENGTFAVLVEPDGRGAERLWVGTAKRGIGLLQHGEWRYFSAADGTLPDEGVRGIWRVTGTDGKPWRLVGMLGGKLLRVDDDLTMKPIATPWAIEPGEAAAFALARESGGAHELWFGTFRSGVHRLRDGRWTTFTAAGAKAPWTVLRIAEQIDARGRSWLWAATNRGLARFDGDAWQIVSDVPDLPDDGLRSVTLIAHGDRTILWAGSNRQGVVRLDVTDPQRPTRAELAVPAAPDPTVYTILADRAGRVYVCTNNGVQQLTPTSDGGYAERVFRRRDGLVHDECNTNAQFVDAHDRYWVGTLGGLSVYDPAIQPVAAPARPKPLYVTALIADGARHDPLVESALDLPAGARELRIDFTLLAGQRELESRYRSRLAGYDPDWTAWTPEHVRNFTGLAPGAYTLDVEARDYAGTASAPTELRFMIGSFWWQRPVSRILGAALALLAVAIGVLLYNRNLRARQRTLTREVAARTAELNTANLRLTELSYADPLTGVANRRRLMESIEAALDRARSKALPLGLIVVDVDHFKDFNDRHGHLAGDAALRAVAQALASATRQQDLVARFGGEEFACLMLDASIDVVAGIAERMGALVEALPPRAIGNDAQTLTISAGILSRVPASDDRAADLLRDADAALYAAKRDGRNRVRRFAG